MSAVFNIVANWGHNINVKLVVLNEKGNARVGDLINVGILKEGRFCKTKRLVVVDGDGSY